MSTEDKKYKITKSICLVVLLFSLLVTVSIAPNSLAKSEHKTITGEECIPQLYDEAHVAYNQEFADRYRFPQEHVQDMPDYLRYIELFIRTEFGKPECYLNFSFKNDPNVFKIPSENYYRPNYPTSLMPDRKGWWKIYPNQSPMKTAKETMWIQIYNKYDRSFPVRNIQIHDMYIQDDYVDVHSRLRGCVIAQVLLKNTPEQNGVLQVQRPNTNLYFSQVDNNPDLRDDFFITIPFPKKWFKEIREPLINADRMRCIKEKIQMQ